MHSKNNFIFSIVVMNLFFMGLSACDLATKANQESLVYSFNINGCETGSHSFSSLDAYCAGLQNNSLNNNCALASRESLFNQKCSGQFSPAKQSPVVLINANTQLILQIR